MLDIERQNKKEIREERPWTPTKIAAHVNIQEPVTDSFSNYNENKPYVIF